MGRNLGVFGGGYCMKLVGFERNFQFFSGFEGFLAVLKMGAAGSALKKNRYAKCAGWEAVFHDQDRKGHKEH